MGLQRKLASLLKCLKSKWKSREQKLLENLQSRGEGVGSSGIHQVSFQYLEGLSNISYNFDSYNFN